MFVIWMLIECYYFMYSCVLFKYFRADLDTVVTKYQFENSNAEEVLILIQRSRLLATTKRAKRKEGFDVRSKPIITFSNEMAEDGGGVRREFFRYFKFCCIGINVC